MTAQIIVPANAVHSLASLPPRPPVRKSILLGTALIVLGLGGFTGWATTAPLASAVVASGTLKVDSHRKTVQHDKGGIIAEIFVRDGDRVSAGQPLLRLDDVETRSQVDLLEGQHIALLAEQARLIAERDDLDRIRFPPELVQRQGEEKVAMALSGQGHIFARERLSLASQTDILNQKISELEAQISAYQSELTAAGLQLRLINEEMSGVAELVEKGLEKKPRLLSLRRTAAQLDGSQGELRGRIAGARQAIGEARLQIVGLHNDHQRDIASALRELENQMGVIAEQLRTARAQQVRREIISPQDGVIMNLHYFASGAVIPAGGPILDVVPGQDRLTAEVRIQPQDIDSVHEGLGAEIMLTAFQSRTTPRVEGAVSWVSADALTDERTQQSYYLARIKPVVAPFFVWAVAGFFQGMRLEAFLLTASLRARNYRFRPFRRSFRRQSKEHGGEGPTGPPPLAIRFSPASMCQRDGFHRQPKSN